MQTHGLHYPDIGNTGRSIHSHGSRFVEKESMRRVAYAYASIGRCFPMRSSNTAVPWSPSTGKTAPQTCLTCFSHRAGILCPRLHSCSRSALSGGKMVVGVGYEQLSQASTSVVAISTDRRPHSYKFISRFPIRHERELTDPFPLQVLQKTTF